MHLVLPFAGPPQMSDAPAAPSSAPSPALSLLSLPRLERLLARLAPSARWDGEPTTLNTPHERALAAAWGWAATDDGLLPMAAVAAAGDGLSPAAGGPGWALLTPTHWQVSADGVTLADPQHLALDAAESRALFDAIVPLFDATGFALHWGAPTRWYAVHDSLAEVPSASLDRVVGQPVDDWWPRQPDARRLRRLQVEAQMLLHTHPINTDREARRLLPVNSFWLSGTGRPQALPADGGGVTLDDRLRAPALAGDLAGWAAAWATLDAGPVADLLARAEAGQPVALTLCGPRRAQQYRPADRSLWQRLTGARRLPAAGALEAL